MVNHPNPQMLRCPMYTHPTNKSKKKTKKNCDFSHQSSFIAKPTNRIATCWGTIRCRRRNFGMSKGRSFNSCGNDSPGLLSILLSIVKLIFCGTNV